MTHEVRMRQWYGARYVAAMLNEHKRSRRAIKKFIDILLVSGVEIQNFGCPVGSLLAELSKLKIPLQEGDASSFSIFRL
ncbi:MAG: hypothetical protein ACRCSF_04110 [Mycobacteriaceae bacterium]